MRNIGHKLFIEAPAEKIYSATTTQEGLAGWWSPDTIAKPERDSIARFRFSPDYYRQMKITALAPVKHVQWLCLTGYEAWIDTTIIFDIEHYKNGALLFFHHDRWKAYTPVLPPAVMTGQFF